MKAATQPTQREIMRGLFAQQPILRARELREAGVDGKTIARAVDDGEINRISRGSRKQHSHVVGHPFPTNLSWPSESVSDRNL